MGRDKATLPFGAGTLLSTVVGVLAGVVEEIVIVARRGQELPDLARSAGAAALRFAFDEIEGKGPLGGLAPGLAALTTADVAYASSCDVPFLQPALVHAMFEALGDRDVAIPEAQGHLHPLAAVYRRTAVLPHVRALLAIDRLRPVFLLERVPHVRVPEATLRAVDPELRSLENLNLPEAYEEALERLRGR